MQYPYLNEIKTERRWTEEFTGLDRRVRAEEGSFSAMGNMAGDPWPLLSSRKRRGLVAELNDPQAMTALGKLAWIDGSTLYYDGQATPVNDLSLAADMLPKRLTAMGVYLVIMPDKRYYNVMDPADRGYIERLWQSEGRVTFAPVTVGSGASREEYVKISCTGIGRGLNPEDGVRISGARYTGNNAVLREQVDALNGPHIAQTVTDDSIMIAGVLDAQFNQDTGAVRVDRRVPQMDFLTECGNRLWGCRYGTQDGGTVNCVYACSLGDFRNWDKFGGTSADSFCADVGSDGPFTGAAVHRGTPHFFKADCVHKIYGDRPGNFQTQRLDCDGVKPGCAESLVDYNGRLYYVGTHGVECFDSLPENRGEALGEEGLKAAAAGQAGGKYYLSAQDENGGWSLYVLDTDHGVWHRQDDSHALCFTELNGELYMLLANGLLCALNGTAGEREPGDVTWFAETAVMGYEYPEHQYMSRFLLRMKLGVKAECRVYIQYDSDGLWRFKGTIPGGDRVKTYLLPVIPRRCEHLKVRFEGHGEMQLYGMARELAIGREEK
ncbi:MAG: hypothetical protein IJQ62_04075 [Clostridia bacterium]|nr:hypothetical protein [Clostridia bacterium]